MALRAPRPPAPQIFAPTPARLPASSIPASSSTETSSIPASQRSWDHRHQTAPPLLTLAFLLFPSLPSSSFPDPNLCWASSLAAECGSASHRIASHRNTNTHTQIHRQDSRETLIPAGNKSRSHTGRPKTATFGRLELCEEEAAEGAPSDALPPHHSSIYPSTEVIYHTVWVRWQGLGAAVGEARNCGWVGEGCVRVCGREREREALGGVGGD